MRESSQNTTPELTGLLGMLEITNGKAKPLELLVMYTVHPHIGLCLRQRYFPTNTPLMHFAHKGVHSCLSWVHVNNTIALLWLLQLTIKVKV